MKKLLPAVLLLTGSLWLAGCSNATKPAFDPATVQQEIEGLNHQFSEMFVKGALFHL